MTITIIETIRNQIANDELGEAIKMFRTNCDEFTDELIIQSSKYTNLKTSIRKGIISREQSNLERNQLCNSLLELLNEVDIEATKPKNESYHMNPELKDILGLAELISRRKGKEKTSTKDFFAALVTMKPESLKSLLQELEAKKALPKSVDSDLLNLPRKLSNNRPLSGCLTESLNELEEISDESLNISAADMFVDVSKHGKGKSVAKLRRRGVGEKEIENYVAEFSLEVKRRN